MEAQEGGAEGQEGAQGGQVSVGLGPFAKAGLLAVVTVALIGCPPAQRRRLAKRIPPPSASLPASLLPPEGAGPKLRRAERAWLAKQPNEALRELAAVLRTEPDHLEARVLLALVQQRARRPKQAAEAWHRVERIIVLKGKLRAFELQTTLLGAAQHYLRRGAEARSKLFLEALWRRFPSGDAAALAQLAVAEQAYRDRRWYHVSRACAELARVRPRHRGNQRCRELALIAKRLLAVGPDAPRQAATWRWESPSPQANDLQAVWVGPKGLGVIVGAAGTILERRRRERRWRVLRPLTRWNLRAIAARDANAIFVVGEGGVVLRRGSAGWRLLRSPAPQNADLHGAWSPDGNTLIAVGDGGVVLHYAKGAFRREQPTKVSLHGVWGADGRHVFAVGGEGTMLAYDGKSWRGFSSDAYEHLRGVWGSSKDHVLVAGDRRTVIFFDGVKAKESVQGMADLGAVWGTGPKTAWAVGKGGTILRSPARRPLGEWAKERSGTIATLHDVRGGGGGIWAVGQGGTILRRRGRRWELEAGGSMESLVGVASAAPGQGIALGLRGKLLTRAGGRWSATVLPIRGIYRALWSADGRSLVAVGHRGLIVIGDGKAYRRIKSNTAEDLLAVQRCGTTIYASGTRGTMLRIEEADGVASVRGERVPAGQRLRGLAGCRSPIVVGDRGVIMARRRGVWRRESSGRMNNLYAVWADAKEREAVAVGEGGLVLRRRGGRWRAERTPLAQTLIGVWGRSPRDLYAVSRGGNVIHYDGETWRLHRSPAACLLAVGGNASEVLAVGCSCGVLRLKR
ncbi:MAG: hypothetical protein CSA65_01165 [Proteobacteria bacterium]|nr:MAG: hypothetical protein CSA65_01165 [Pseudomonadota bacterium]